MPISPLLKILVSTLVLICSAFSVWASEPSKPAKLAFIVGNQDYHNPQLSLANPINDAQMMGQALTALGFTTHLVTNANRESFEQQFRDFLSQARQIERTGQPLVTLLFYAGHGVQYDTVNYLVPVDTKLLEQDVVLGDDVQREFISLKKVTSRLSTLSSLVNIVVLDACRDLPIYELDNNIGGWADVVEKDFFVAFGTGPGAKAQDGIEGDNGVFTKAILDNIHSPGLNLSQLFQNVRKQVEDVTAGMQSPQESNRSTYDFYFIEPETTSNLFYYLAIVLSVVGLTATIWYHRRQRRGWVEGLDLTNYMSMSEDELAQFSIVKQQQIYGYLKDLKHKKVIALIQQEPLLLGRDKRCQVQFDDPQQVISRFHCELGYDEKQQVFWLSENKHKPSTNGTYLTSLKSQQQGKMPVGQKVIVKPGEVFYLANPNKKQGWPLVVLKHKARGE